ncbi:Hint domain-containing protein [Candidatus Woesearchaeota archaeon]|nr:Hint domain-containing protein [Candidatus Woesearchaeota archaeon]
MTDRPFQRNLYDQRAIDNQGESRGGASIDDYLAAAPSAAELPAGRSYSPLKMAYLSAALVTLLAIAGCNCNNPTTTPTTTTPTTTKPTTPTTTTPTTTTPTTTTPEPVDEKPRIIYEDNVPNMVYIGDNVTVTFKATDDKGIEEVIAYVNTPEGRENLTLKNKNGSYEATYGPEVEGDHKIIAEATDTGSQKTVEELDTFSSVRDNKPEISYNGTLPESVYVGDNVTINGLEAKDDVKLESLVVYARNAEGKETPIGKDNGNYIYAPKEEGLHTIVAKATDSRGQETIKELGEFTAKIDNFPEIASYRIGGIEIKDIENPRTIDVQSYTNFSISVNASDDISLESVIIQIEGIEDPIVLEEKDGVWTGSSIIRMDGLYDYTITAKDSRGQEKKAEGEIRSTTPAPPPPPPPPVCCFPAGTKIDTPKGKRNIEEVKVGDMVISFDTETNDVREARVLELEAPVREGYFVLNDGLLRLTDEHPVFVRKMDGRKGWASLNPEKTMEDSPIQVLKLEIGDEVFNLNTQTSGKLLTFTKQWVRIASIKYVEGRVQTYNLKTIEKEHTFFADGVLVHNKGALVGCFIKGSRVLMADKGMKNIEKIKVGDEVFGLSKKTRKWGKYKVSEIQAVKGKKGYFIINKKLRVSPVHQIYVNGGAKTAPEIRLNDTIINGHKKKKVTSIELIEEKADRHNIVLGRDKDAMFMVDDVLVCNGW